MIARPQRFASLHVVSTSKRKYMLNDTRSMVPGKTKSSAVRILLIVLLAFATATTRADESLIAHWPLDGDGRDISGNNLHAAAHDIDFTAAGPTNRSRTAATFDGRSSRLEVPGHEIFNLGDDDFTIVAWVYTGDTTDDVQGDIISKYDLLTHRGFHLSIKTNAGVTFSQPNFRQLEFGIDDDRAETEWSDCGKPGNALLAFALCSFEGHLYAGTCEPGRDESGRVYRYAGEQKWIECGAPDKPNAVTALAVFSGQLYAGTGKYRVAGSSLPESENMNRGGRIFRYDPPSGWIDCGQLADTEAVGGLVVFHKTLYATSLYHPAGFFRYEGNRVWQKCEIPTRPADLKGDSTHMRVEALAPFNGALYATSYDGGRVFRFDGRHWTDCGGLADNTQTYSLSVYAGELYAGTWPSGRVYRFQEPNRWHDCGRLGDELEVMGMLVYNGRLIAGTLPLAEIYQFGGRNVWHKLARLDDTPNVRYRRAWCLAEHGGQVFCSTLPSGKIFSWQAGQLALANQELPPGWHHVAAVRTRQPSPSGRARVRGTPRSNELTIYVNGLQVAKHISSEAAPYNLSTKVPLQIGFGPNDHFHGRLSNIRLYRRALTISEIAMHSKK
jgi:hypothetical protein